MNILILTHGAGSNRNAPLLIAVDQAFTAAGIEVIRYDLPFRQERPAGPPHPSTAARDRQGLREQVMKAREKNPEKIWLGGHSYGGRQASILASEEPGLVDVLLLLSYPLHPPNKPAQMRTAHFPALRTPAIFVHGPRDPFATRDELNEAIGLIPAAVQVLEIPNTGHDLGKDRAGVAKKLLDAALASDGLSRKP